MNHLQQSRIPADPRPVHGFLDRDAKHLDVIPAATIAISWNLAPKWFPWLTLMVLFVGWLAVMDWKLVELEKSVELCKARFEEAGGGVKMDAWSVEYILWLSATSCRGDSVVP
jgi:hypothetical protein